MSRPIHHKPGPRRGALHRWRRRWGGPKNPLPSSTTDLTPADWRIIKLALEECERTMIDHGSWSAAEAANALRWKIADR